MHNSSIPEAPRDTTRGAREALSALMDGEAASHQLQGAFDAWRSDDQARQCWHTYHLIGDVLRSDELAAVPGRDQTFLRGLRDRLVQEPVPFAPTALAAPEAAVVSRGRARLMAPMAIAAGVVAVAGVMVVLRVSTPVPVSLPATAAAAAGQGGPDVVAVSGQLIRDARLERYFNAHRQVSNGVAVHVPGGVVRSVDTIVLEAK